MIHGYVFFINIYIIKVECININYVYHFYYNTLNDTSFIFYYQDQYNFLCDIRDEMSHGFATRTVRLP